MPNRWPILRVTCDLKVNGGHKLGLQSIALAPRWSWAEMQIRLKLEWELLSIMLSLLRHMRWGRTKAVHPFIQTKPNSVFHPPCTVNTTPKVKGSFNNKTFIIAQTRTMGSRQLPVVELECGKSTTIAMRNQQFPRRRYPSLQAYNRTHSWPKLGQIHTQSEKENYWKGTDYSRFPPANGRQHRHTRCDQEIWWMLLLSAIQWKIDVVFFLPWWNCVSWVCTQEHYCDLWIL